MMSAVTDHHLKTLRHMLGVDNLTTGKLVPYRDYYCANPMDATMDELEQLSLVRKYAERGGYWWYCTTDSGRALAMASAKRPRYTKPKRMYSAYLDLRDCIPDLTFRQFLTSADYAAMRAKV